MSNRTEGAGVSINTVTRLPGDRMSRCPRWLPKARLHPPRSHLPLMGVKMGLGDEGWRKGV